MPPLFLAIFMEALGSSSALANTALWIVDRSIGWGYAPADPEAP